LRVDGTPADGDVVDLATHDGTFVARGLWNSASRLRVRLYAFDAATRLDDQLWKARIAAAVGLRRTLGLDDRGGAARLVNSEGDDLSGLIVDRYGDWLSVQVTALAMARRLDAICDALEPLVAPRGILLRGADRGLAKLEGLHLPDRLVRGVAPSGPIFVEEHGLKFGVDLAEGQKTDRRRPGSPAAGGCSTCSATLAASPWPAPRAAHGACSPATRARKRPHWRRPMPTSTAPPTWPSRPPTPSRSSPPSGRRASTLAW
jgi:hypothetical protein